MDESTCLFCNLPQERILYENSVGFAIRDAFPVSPGHTLIIPHQHYPDFFAIPAEERQQLLTLLDQAKTELDQSLAPQGYNIGINCGAVAGQTVFHLHIHLIPRYQGDQEDPRGGVRKIFADKARYW